MKQMRLETHLKALPSVLIDPGDFDHYDTSLRSYLRGELDEQRFLYTRLNLGVYAQRQDGMCMVRCKLTGGLLDSGQLRGLALALEDYSIAEHCQITTRQDIQFHHVPLEKTPELLRDLAAAGITTREAGGNTVRNITTCPLAGVCPAEYVDVSVYAGKVAARFIRHPLTQALPRKFKISFSGCEADCARGLVHDLGVIASQREGLPGFRLLTAGGLGAKPRTAIELLPFVPEHQLIPAIEALLALHDRHSDRKRRTRSRFKFLLDRWGASEFRRRFESEFGRTLSAFSPGQGPLREWRQPQFSGTPLGAAIDQPVAQRQPGMMSLPLHLSGGRLNSGQLLGLTSLLQAEEGLEVRASQDQNLILHNLPEKDLERIRVALEACDLPVYERGHRVVACPGTITCPLGITNSQRLAFALDGGSADLRVAINGCQNGCANASLADIGFYGKAKRHFGRLVPSYRVQLGGDGRSGGELAFDGPDVPAARVFSTLARIRDAFDTDRAGEEHFFDWSRRKGPAYFKQLLGDLSRVGQSELAFVSRDLGDSTVFKVQAMGAGECAGTQLNRDERLLLEASYEAELARTYAGKFKYDEATECLENQLSSIARALLLARGVEEAVLDQALSDFLGSAQPMPLPTRLTPMRGLLERIARFRDCPDESGLPDIARQLDQWHVWVSKQVGRGIPAHSYSGTDG